MMNYNYLKLAVLLTVFIVQSLHAQVHQFTLNNGKSSIIIEGTSTIHNWEMKAGNFACNMKVNMESNEIRDIRNVDLKVKSKSIKSDNSTMNSKTEKAMKVSYYPDINFQMVSLNDFRKTGNDYSGHLWGNLTIAGVTKYVKINFISRMTGNGNINVTGSKKIDITTFKIDPPTAMLGSLKTGKDITISFDLHFISD
jgi:polyisoprenoid-binding protein YceI